MLLREVSFVIDVRQEKPQKYADEKLQTFMVVVSCSKYIHCSDKTKNVTSTKTTVREV